MLPLLKGVFALSKYRIKFSKTGRGKFISHLDLLRAFNRTVMRAGLPVRYTQGFNPHQIMTFALPLSVGTESITEFVDIDFEDGTDFEEILNGLNANFPEDLRALSVAEPVFKAKDIFAAEYNISIKADFEGKSDKIPEFFSQSEYTVMKKSKKGEKEVNLMDFIYSFELLESDGRIVKMKLMLAAGGDKNVKPDLILGNLEKYLAPVEFDASEVCRVNIFCKNGEKVENFC